MGNYLLLSVFPKIGFLSLLTVILSGISFVFIMAADDEKNEKTYSLLNQVAAIFLTSMSLWILIPDKKEILQLKAINLLTNTKGVEKLPENLVHKLNELLGDD